MRGLKNKVAVVTGAAGGIGSAICKRFLEEGVNIVAIDLNADALKQLAAGLGAGEDRLLCVTADIADYARVKEAVDRGVAKFGKLDILVNNAGWDVASPFLKTEPDLWEKIIDINLRGPLNLHKAVLPHLVAAGGGKVVNVASDAGRVGSSGEAVYAACKGGLISFSKTIARECARVLKPGGLLVFMDSWQTGDTPEFDAMLESFPANFHEPFYKSYLTEDLRAIFTEAGLQVVGSEPVFLSKRVAARKL